MLCPATPTDSSACDGPPPQPSSPAFAVSRYQRKDHFHQLAKREGLRSRAAYKLDEIQRAQRFLKPGQLVFDLGCWPGSWLELSSEIVGARGRVVGVDRAELDPPLKLDNAVSLVGDLEDPALSGRLLAELGGRADVVLSDAAPKLSGVRDADRANEERLLEAIESLLPVLLKKGGSLLFKLLDGPEARVVAARIRARFSRARELKPSASRQGSSERYVLARGFLDGPPPAG